MNLSKDRQKILALIGLLAIFVSFINPSWLYDPYGSIDHWAYLGQMYSFPKLQLLFPGHPSGDLLPLILPGAMLYKIFPPLLANYLQDLIFLTLTLVSLFLLIQDNIDTATATITVCFAAGYQFLLSAIGSDYTDGKVIPYYMLTLYFTSVARRDTEHARKFAILSGAAFALMVFTAALSLAYIPVIVLFYAVTFLQQDGSWLTVALRRAIRFLPFFALGALLTTVTLGSIHFLYTGKFIFFSNTISKLLRFANGYTPPPLRTWAPHASWLIIPFLTFIANFCFIAMALSKGERFDSWNEKHIFALMNMMSIFIMVSVEVFFHQSTLQHLYFDQTLPIMFLGLAVILSKTESSVKINRLTAATALGLSVIVLMAVHGFGQHLQETLISKLNGSDLSLLFGMGASGVLGLGIWLYLLQIIEKPWTRFAVLAVLAVINLFSFVPSFFASAIATKPQIFMATIQWMNFFETVDPTRIGHFWYNENEPYGLLFKQFNAVSYLNMEILRVNKTFPNLDEYTHPSQPLASWQWGQEGKAPKAGDTIIVCTQYPNAIVLARNSLAKFQIGIQNYSVYLFKNELQTFEVTKIQTNANVQ